MIFTFFRLALLALVCFTSFSSQAEGIDSIIIEGNLKTRDEIILQEMALKPGDEPSEQALKQSRQAIMDLGLFRQVEIELSEQGDKTQLLVHIKEKKHDWYVLPRLERNGDGDITLGINWRENNLFGLNQTSRFTLTHKDFDDASRDKEIRLKWKFVYPRIIDTQLSSYAYVSLSQVGLEEEREGLTGFYDRDEHTAGIGLGRWFARSGASKGFHADLGLEFTRFEHEHLGGQADFYDNASVLSLLASVSYSKVRDFLYSREGHAMGIKLKQSRKSWHSDRNFFYKSLYFRRYFLLPFRDHTNFNFQAQLASGDNSLFGEPIYELSGGHTLRGYPREILEGDAFFLVNTEFLTPLFGKNNVRGGFLFDFGNAYQSLGDAKDDGLEYGAGLSLRWKFKQWVNTELRIDYAQGFGDEGESRVYVASSATF